MNERCTDCRYWFAMPLSKETDTGLKIVAGKCHRGPPVLVSLDPMDIGMVVWPTTQSNDWCGEWSARDEE